MSARIRVQITAAGGARMLHDDAVDLSELGEVTVTRASHVEWERYGWYVESARTGEVLACGFATRAEALDWEREHYSPAGAGWAELIEEEK